MLAQVRVLISQPEVVAGTWAAAWAAAPGVSEAELRETLTSLAPLWDELFPARQARFVRLLVQRVTLSPGGADIQLQVEGLAGMVRDLGAGRPAVLEVTLSPRLLSPGNPALSGPDPASAMHQ